LLAGQFQSAYRAANTWLGQRGVVANEDLRSRVKRAPSSSMALEGASSASASLSGGLDSTARAGVAACTGLVVPGPTTPSCCRAAARCAPRLCAHGLIGQLQRLLARSVGELPGMAGLAALAPQPGGVVALAPGLLAARNAAPASEALAQALAPCVARPRGRRARSACAPCRCWSIRGS
jgi:hypothetical protein